MLQCSSTIGLLSTKKRFVVGLPRKKTLPKNFAIGVFSAKELFYDRDILRKGSLEKSSVMGLFSAKETYVNVFPIITAKCSSLVR